MSLKQSWEAYKLEHRIDLLRSKAMQEELQATFYAGAEAYRRFNRPFSANPQSIDAEIDQFKKGPLMSGPEGEGV